MSDKAARLVVFLTKNMSLRLWDDAGVLEREIALYRGIRPWGGRVAIISYGGPEDLAYASRWDNIEVCCNKWNLPKFLYVLLVPWLHRGVLREARVFKSNQIYGSDLMLWAGRFHKQARIVARCGYIWSWNAKRLAKGRWSREYQRALRAERALFTKADVTVVTAEAGRRYVIDGYSVPQSKVRVIPNYVLPEMFRQTLQQNRTVRRVLFVGRLHEEKNILMLVNAMQGLKAELVVIGDGPLRGKLKEEASKRGVVLKLLGVRPHHEIVKDFAAADIFILPSQYENHPKALIEAMAAGMPVIGTDVEGIKELIDHLSNGILCKASVESIREAISRLLTDSSLRERIGQRARELALQRFSLAHVLELELAMLSAVAGPMDEPSNTAKGSEMKVPVTESAGVEG